jgi:HD-GYP domain-containing protein (c-di-GMP phosphodiesterase class II)
MALKLLVFLLPIISAVLAVRCFVAVVPAPSGRLAFWVWMATLVSVSFAVAMAMQRALRRVAPLTVLLKMSLVVPDEAPARFGLALRTGTARSLRRSVDDADELRSDEQVYAEHLLASMGALSRHDRMTTGHSERVRAYAVMLGEEIGLSTAELDKLNWAALVHDIGKLEVPAEILNKPGRPTNDEWAVLRTHPGAGYFHVQPLRPWLGDWVDAATQHHERWDGGGYPLGLAGAQISLAGRIVAIADAFDVMTAARSYKKPLGAEQARAELTLNSGTQFDPHLVRSFLQISLGRMRRVVGPLGLLANFPDLIRVPLTVALTSTTAVVTAAAIAAGAGAGAIAPRNVSPRPEVEETMVIEDARVSAAPTPRGEPDLDAAPPASGPTTTSDEPATTAPTDPIVDEASAATGATPPSDDTVVPATPTSATTPTTATTLTGATAPTPPAPIPPSATSTPPAPTAPSATTTPPAPTTPNPTTTTPASPPTTVDTSPVADDTATTRSGSKVTVHVLQNDRFPGADVDAKTLTVVVAPANGTVTIVAGRNLQYESNIGFSGTDTLTYQVCSTLGACDTAVVTVTVT